MATQSSTGLPSDASSEAAAFRAAMASKSAKPQDLAGEAAAYRRAIGGGKAYQPPMPNETAYEIGTAVGPPRPAMTSDEAIARAEKSAAPQEYDFLSQEIGQRGRRMMSKPGQVPAYDRIMDAATKHAKSLKTAEERAKLPPEVLMNGLSFSGPNLPEKSVKIEVVEAAAKSDQVIAKVLSEARAAQRLRNAESEKYKGSISSFYEGQAPNGMIKRTAREQSIPGKAQAPVPMSDQDVADIVYQAMSKREGEYRSDLLNRAGGVAKFSDTALDSAAMAAALGPVAAAAGGGVAGLAVAGGGLNAAMQAGRLATGASEEFDVAQFAKDTAIAAGAGLLGRGLQSLIEARGIKGAGDVLKNAIAAEKAGQPLPASYRTVLDEAAKVREVAQKWGARATDASLNLGQLGDEMQMAARGVGPERSWWERAGDVVGGTIGAHVGGAGKSAMRHERAPTEPAGVDSVRLEPHRTTDAGAERLKATEPTVDFAERLKGPIEDAVAAPREWEADIAAREARPREVAKVSEEVLRKTRGDVGDEIRAEARKPTTPAEIKAELKALHEAVKKAEAAGADSSGLKAKVRIAEADLRGAPKSKPAGLTWKQQKQFLGRVAEIERTQGSPATPAQKAVVRKMIQLDRPGLEAALPPRVDRLPTARADIEAREMASRARIERDLASNPYAMFEQKARVIQREARLRPSKDRPEMLFRKALEIGDTVLYAGDSKSMRPMPAEDVSLITEAIERGDVVVSKPRAELATQGVDRGRAGRAAEDYKITAEVTSKDGKKRRITVYKDTPDGRWGELRDLARDISRRGTVEKMRSGPISTEDLIERLKDPSEKRLREVGSLVSARVTLESIKDWSRGAMAKALSPVLSKGGAARFIEWAFGEGQSQPTSLIGKAVESRLAPLWRDHLTTQGDFFAEVAKVAGNSEALRRDLQAAVFDHLETRGRAASQEASKFPPGELQRVLEAGRRYAKAAKKVGDELVKADVIPVARFQAKDVNGENVGPMVVVLDSDIREGRMSLDTYKGSNGLKDGQRWELVGGMEKHNELGHFLRHQAAFAEESTRLGRFKSFLGRKGFSPITASGIKRFTAARSEWDILGKEGNYVRSLEPTMEAIESELAYLGTEFTLQEARKAGLAKREAELAESGGDAGDLAKEIGVANARIDEIRAEIAAKPGDDAVALLSAERLGLRRHVRDLRRRFTAIESGNEKIAWVPLDNPRWGKWYDPRDGHRWYIDRSIWNSLNSAGYVKPGYFRKSYLALSNIAKSMKAISGNPFRVITEGATNLRLLQEGGVQITGDGAVDDMKMAAAATLDRISGDMSKVPPEVQEFLITGWKSQFGGSNTIEGMDHAGIRRAKADVAEAVRHLGPPDVIAANIELGAQYVQQFLDKLPGYGWGRKAAREFSDFATALYGFLRLRRHGVEGSGPMSAADATAKIVEMMDLRSVTSGVRALATTPFVGADFLRYRAKVLEATINATSLPPRIFGKRIPTPALDRAIAADPLSGKAKAAVLTRGAMRHVSKALEWTIPALITRAVVKKMFFNDEQDEKGFEDSLDRKYAYMDPVSRAYTKAMAMPLGKDAYGDYRHALLDFASPAYTLPTYFYTGVANGQYNMARPLNFLTAYSVLGNALTQDLTDTDYRGFRSGSKQFVGQKTLEAFTPTSIMAMSKAVEDFFEKDERAEDVVYDLAGALLGIKIKVVNAADPGQEVLDAARRLGYIKFGDLATNEYSSGSRSLVNAVDPEEDFEKYVLIDTLLSVSKAMPDTYKKMIRKVQRAQSEALTDALR